MASLLYDPEERRYLDELRALAWKECRDSGAYFITVKWVADRLNKSVEWVQLIWDWGECRENDVEKEKESAEVTTPSASDEKKPEDIVYAELDLTLEGGNGKPQVIVRCPDDKTEYAEIIGVVPHVQNIDETKKEKSPSGSNNPSPKK